MALFGRESHVERERAERVRLWVHARTPFALFSVMTGMLALIDFFTPLALPLGIAAMVLGWKGLNDIDRRPAMLGRRLCRAGMLLGGFGLLVSVIFHVRMWWA